MKIEQRSGSAKAPRGCGGQLAGAAWLLALAGCTVTGAGPAGGGGQVLLTQDAQTLATVTASFAAESCTLRVAGLCDVRFCPLAPADGGTGERSAGALHVGGLARDVTLEPEADGSYTPSAVGHLWSGGEHATLHVDGDKTTDPVFPALDAGLVTPQRIRLLAPAGALTWDRTHDLPFQWPSGSDDVHVTIASNQDPAYDTRIDCAFDGGPGQASIPSLALTLMPTGPALWSVTTRAITHVNGEVPIDFIAEQAAHFPDQTESDVSDDTEATDRIDLQ